jgi:hypothetical protein
MIMDIHIMIMEIHIMLKLTAIVLKLTILLLESLQILSILYLIVSSDKQIDVLIVSVSLSKHVRFGRLGLKCVHIELPLLTWKSIMFEVTFINGDDDYFFLDELSHQPANPKPSFIIVSVSILGVGFV